MVIGTTASILATMEYLRDKAYKNSVDKGCWEENTVMMVTEGCMGPLPTEVKLKPWNFGEKCALITSEVSEMFEAWRTNKGDTEKPISIATETGERRMTAIEEEVADIFIRMFDLCGKLDIDIGAVILAKMEYNATRPHMHGGRKC